MSDEPRVPAPIESLIRAVAGGTDDDERATTFARGLAIGALVGAAIAGSTIWQRRHGHREARVSAVRADAAPGDSTPAEP